MNIIAFLTGSKLGRYVAIFGLASAGVLLLLVSAFLKGQEAEKIRQSKNNLNSLKKRIKSDDEIYKMARSDRRRELARWMLDD